MKLLALTLVLIALFGVTMTADAAPPAPDAAEGA
jgi:hypothetical protein